MKIQAKCRIPVGLHVYRNKNDVWGSTTPAGVEEAEIWRGNSWDTVPRIVKYITANSAANGGRNQNIIFSKPFKTYIVPISLRRSVILVANKPGPNDPAPKERYICFWCFEELTN